MLSLGLFLIMGNVRRCHIWSASKLRQSTPDHDPVREPKTNKLDSYHSQYQFLIITII